MKQGMITDGQQQITPYFWYRLACAVPLFVAYCYGGTLICGDPISWLGWTGIGGVGVLVGGYISW